MPRGVKTCPKCGVENSTLARTCKDCGYEFPKGKSKKKAPAVDESLPEFSPGLTKEGGIMLFYPRTGEYHYIKPDEVALIRRLFDSEPRVSIDWTHLPISSGAALLPQNFRGDDSAD